ncbi:helix-turn-helix domain-containing protein [candidate division KSB1 bacterium]
MIIITFLLIAGAIQGFLLSIVLFTISRTNKTANRILALVIIIFSLSISVHALIHAELIFNIPYHPEVLQLLFYLLGPLLYFYLLALTEIDFQFKNRLYLHFIPFFAACLTFFPLYAEILANPSHVDSSIFDEICIIQTWILIAHFVIYIFLCFRKLHIHSQDVKQSHSSLEKVNLDWLKLLLTGILITWIVGICVEFLTIKPAAWDIVWLIVSIIIYMIGYMGLKQPAIFQGKGLDEQKSSIKSKYEKSTLKPELAEEYIKKLNEYMESEKPYLESDITLYSLASKLSISAHHLSRIINERFNRNFFEFINEYRIEEAKKLIVDPLNHNINIASLGLDAGFNSVSAFNAAFKKYTGMAPSQYRISDTNS